MTVTSARTADSRAVDTAFETGGGEWSTDATAVSTARLLPRGARPLSLYEHVEVHGPPAYLGGPRRLIDLARRAGLTGRGGAAFPTHRKMTAVADAAEAAGASPARGQAVVVANGAEGEPAAHKDKTLLYADPHLVLDGLQLAAEAVGARTAYLYVHRDERVLRRLRAALAERGAAAGRISEPARTARTIGTAWTVGAVDRVPVILVDAPPRFLAGQESALVHRIDGGPATPRFSPRRVAERGVGGAPTLVQNVETLAHLALIARHGAAWFRALGTPEEPGTMLTTIHLGDAAPRVVEAALGTPLAALLDLGIRPARAVLVGGYHGTWMSAERAAALPLANAALSVEGAALGAGVLAALPPARCGLDETARIVGYLAAESAGQCGPCLNGLPRIARALAELARPVPSRRQGRSPGLREAVERWSGLVVGRGACHHPDGSVRLVRSAMSVFAEELQLHERGVCSDPYRSADPRGPGDVRGSGDSHSSDNSHGSDDSRRLPFLPVPGNPPRRHEDWS